MTYDKGILIRNIYHMLTYAFQELRRDNYNHISKEDFEYIQDLFAEILYRGLSFQLKHGLHREYIEHKDTLPILRGKLDINETIRNKIRRKQVLACEYDELFENNIFNQILKTTAIILIRDSHVKPERKQALKSLMYCFNEVSVIDPFSIHWNMLRIQRNNQTYRMLMNICRFILEGMLMTTKSGSYKMATFSDEHMSKLFEKFVLEYYRRNYSGLSANPDQIDWDITDRDIASIGFLPEMKSDITLHKGNRTLIIDTKYYGRMMQEQYDKKTIHSGNLYQIFAYVKNMDKDNTGLVSGMLLYAKTQEAIEPDLTAHFGNNRIMVRTLDLNKEFKDIEKQLEELAQEIDR